MVIVVGELILLYLYLDVKSMVAPLFFPGFAVCLDNPHPSASKN